MGGSLPQAPGDDPRRAEHLRALLDQVYRLGATDIDAAWERVCVRVGELLATQRGLVLLAHRPEHCPGDPLGGWRPVRLLHHGPDRAERARAAAALQKSGAYLRDPTTRALAAGSGRHRAARLRDLVDPASDEWRQAPGRELLEAFGVHDRLVAACAVDAAVEVFFVYDRCAGEPGFSAADVAAMEAVMPGFCRPGRWLSLSHGAYPDQRLLSPRERQVLSQLLGSRSEAEIADDLAIRTSYCHQVVVSIFRKLGVTSRAELMSLWLADLHPQPRTGRDGA